jgi:ribulose 1,5-bisphosphate synthetase/thiazole synthase
METFKVTMTHGTYGPGQPVESDFDCDVLIVGGGPAGATTAYYLALTQKP